MRRSAGSTPTALSTASSPASYRHRIRGGRRVCRRTTAPRRSNRGRSRRGAPRPVMTAQGLPSGKSSRGFRDRDRARHRLLADPGCGWPNRPKVRIAPRPESAIERAGIEGRSRRALPPSSRPDHALDTDFWPRRWDTSTAKSSLRFRDLDRARPRVSAAPRGASSSRSCSPRSASRRESSPSSPTLDRGCPKFFSPSHLAWVVGPNMAHRPREMRRCLPRAWA